MKKPIKSKTFIFFSKILIIFSSILFISAQETAKFKVGDRIEADTSGSLKYWKKRTVIAFQENDIYNGYSQDSGYFYRVKFDHIPDRPEGLLVQSERSGKQPTGREPSIPAFRMNHSAAGNVVANKALTGNIKVSALPKIDWRIT
jgi:hypothetical protein